MVLPNQKADARRSLTQRVPDDEARTVMSAPGTKRTNSIDAATSATDPYPTVPMAFDRALASENGWSGHHLVRRA